VTTTTSIGFGAPPAIRGSAPCWRRTAAPSSSWPTPTCRGNNCRARGARRATAAVVVASAVGGTCDGPADFPGSYHQAELALRIQAASGAGDGVTAFNQLGVYRLLAEIEETSSVESLRAGVAWGPCLDYDSRKRSELMPTLARYLACGGNYDATASALGVHRSTCKYRVQRIKEISGHDLSDPEVHFNTSSWRPAPGARCWRCAGGRR